MSLLQAATMVLFAVAAVPSQSATIHERKLASSPAALFLAFAAFSVLLVGGVIAGKQSLQKKNRNPLRFITSWWRRRQQGYIRQDDTQEESVMTSVYSYYPPPSFSTSTSPKEAVQEQEEVSTMTKSVYYENSPMLPPRPDEDEFILSDTCTYIPPPTPPDTVIPPSRVSQTRNHYWNDTSSFQSSLESVDSLVESYWDPSDDQSQLSCLVPVEMNPSFVIEEHISFLQHQAKEAAREELSRAKGTSTRKVGRESSY